jgi:5'-nucleotidase
MRVLVTNDDGVDAPGLRALAEAAAAGGHAVTVAAPLTEASGMSAALTAVTDGGRIVLERRDLGPLPAFGVAASPAYIVILAGLGVFGPPPEVVLSGVNRGANAGHAVLHSATVGAALTAAAAGTRAMAVSLDVLTVSYDEARGASHGEAGSAGRGEAGSGGAAITVPDDDALHWPAAAAMAGELLETLVGAPPGTLLNLNVPDRPRDRIAGLRQAALASFGQARMAVAESGTDFVRTSVVRSGEPLVPGTDLALLADGYATVTTLRPLAEATPITVPTQRDRRVRD